MRTALTFCCALISLVVLAEVCSCADGRAGRGTTKTLMIADFEDESVLDLIDTSGVSISLTDKDVVTGKRALEVRVRPFAVHQNHWPVIVLADKFLKKAIDCSNYSHIAVTIRNVTEGMAGVKVNLTSLAHGDGGRALDETYWEIPAGESMLCTFPMSGLPKPMNDPSHIGLIMILFPDNEVDAVYRIDTIQAVYDPAQGSPAETLVSYAQSVGQQLEAAYKKVDWNAVPDDVRGDIQPRFKGYIQQVKGIQSVAAAGLTEGLQGKYNSNKEQLDKISRQLGQVRLADKRDFFAWEISPYINVYRDERVDFDSPELKAIDIKMALDEYRDKVFMVSSCGKDLRLGVEVRPSGALPAKAIWVREALYINFKKDLEALGDALYDLEGPLQVPKNECRQVWLTFDSRYSGLQPGEYSFSVVLTDLDTGTERQIPGTVTVWDFELPNYDSLANNGYVEFFNSEVGLKVRDKGVEHMKRYGLNMVLVYWNYMPWPVDLDANGNIINFDTTNLEGQVRSVVEAWKAAPGNNERLRFILAISNSPKNLLKRKDIAYPSDEWKNVMGQWLQMLKQSMGQMGVAEEDYVLMLTDESNMTVLLNYELPLAEMIMDVAPGTKIMTNRGPGIKDRDMSFRFYKAFDSMLSRGDRDEQYPYLQDWIKLGNKQPELWTYKCHDMSARYSNLYEYYRVYGWENFAWGITGPGLWTYCARGTSPWGDEKIMIGHGLVFKHKDKNDIVHSRRYEFYREGVDDYRYLVTLTDLAKLKSPAAQASAEKLVDQALADIKSNMQDTTRCEKWRMRVAQEIFALKNEN